jgi:hypothetical protein
MLPHPSHKIIEAAERAAATNSTAVLANERYSKLAGDFRSTALTATSGLQALLAEIESADGIRPPQPSTVRGLVGQSLIGLQSRALWWLIRALRLRDKALRVTEGVLSEMEIELNRLRVRVEDLERQAQERENRDRTR